MRYSIIIPTLNEEAIIGQCLEHAQQAAQKASVEFILVDGGSIDATMAIAKAAGIQVIQTEKGRGQQCNAGAAAAKGKVLLFLHADNFLPEGTFPVLDQLFFEEHIQIGSFRTRYIERHWWLDMHDRFAHIDSAYSTFGDQCITMRKDLFEALGGYPEIPLFEDVALLQAARKRSKIQTFPLYLLISGRRFLENGVFWQSLFNISILTLYLIGVSPWWLARFYYDNPPKRPTKSIPA
ncbi:MAG: TIGR04283 family arsenosugar biosynthesis glycosyltransferase [Bacteroidota bacterium]